MKKTLALLTALLMGFTMNSCGVLYYMYLKDHQRSTEPTPTEMESFNFRECDLAQEGAPEVIRAELTGTFTQDMTMRSIYGVNVLHDGVVGRVGSPLEISGAALSEGTLTFKYDANALGYVPPENLIVLHYNEEDAFYDTLPSTLDVQNAVVNVSITEPGVYLLADGYAWNSAWNDDVSDFTAHRNTYRDDDFKFLIDIPEEITLRHVSDYLKDDEEGRCQTLLECEQNDSIQVGIEYLERPYYDSAKAFANSIAKALDEQEALFDSGTLVHDSATKGYYVCSQFDDTAYSVNAFFAMTDTQYINVWYGFTDKAYLEDVMDSLRSFTFFDTPDLPEPQEYAEDFDYSYYRDFNAMDVSIAMPDGIALKQVERDWNTETTGGRTARIYVPLLETDGTPPPYVQDLRIDLVESPKSARLDAEAAASRGGKANRKPRDNDQIKLENGQTGYLVSVEEGESIALYGFYTVPNTHQYLRVFFQLDSAYADGHYQDYWDALHTVNTTGAAAITPEQLHIEFPEGMAANRYPLLHWTRESTNDGKYFYRMHLLQADWSQNRGNERVIPCSGAFYYLMYTGRTAQEEAHKVQADLEKWGNRIGRTEEITLDSGQTGYLLWSRRAENEEYGFGYLYGFYELPDTDQFVEIELYLDEPVTEEQIEPLWTMLHGVRIS